MSITLRSKTPGTSMNSETPLIVLGAVILIVIVVLLSFFPMTWNAKDEEYIQDLEQKVIALEGKMAEHTLLLTKSQSDEKNHAQVDRVQVDQVEMDRLLAGSRALEQSLSTQTKIMEKKVAELQMQVEELRRGMAREKRKPDVVPHRKAVQPTVANNIAEKKKKGPVYHVVRQGETFYSISKSYGLSLKKLRELNKFDDNTKLYPGQSIIVGP